jgi:magnesium chelatase family protein
MRSENVYLDEAPEFGARVLEALRQPLESGEVVLSRAHGSTRYPARIQLVLAANPCPCAKPGGDAHCECSSLVRRRYLGRLSGPLLDRVDLRIELAQVTAAQLMQDTTSAEPSAVVAERVAKARAAAAARWAEHGWPTNGDVPGSTLRGRPWRLPRSATAELTRQVEAGELSARGFDRVLRVAWTIADLDGRPHPNGGDVRESLGMRIGRTR